MLCIVFCLTRCDVFSWHSFCELLVGMIDGVLDEEDTITVPCLAQQRPAGQARHGTTATRIVRTCFMMESIG